MRKFFGLIINEYVKIVCKTSTKILLAAVILVALGYNLIVNFSVSEMNRSRGRYSWGPDDYISNAKSEKYEGWERDVELHTYFKENNIEMRGFQNEDDPDIWRHVAVYSLFNIKDMLKEAESGGDGADMLAEIKKLAEDMDSAIKNKDWKAYYRCELTSLGISGNGDPTQNDMDMYVWALQYRIDNDVPPGNWKDEVLNTISWNKQRLQTEYKEVEKTDDKYAEKVRLENELAIAEYRLEQDVESYTYDGIESISNLYGGSKPGLWNIFASSVTTISIISVLIIVVAGSLLSSEFSAGTVKFLLINPVKRWKIFTAKYVSVLSITLLALIVLYIFNFIFAGILFGFGNFGAPFLSAAEGAVHAGSSFAYVAGKYLLGSVGMVCMATFAFAISSLVRNSALSIGLGVFLLLIGSSAVQILNMLGFYQAKYILFANTDLNAVINGNTGFINHTLTFTLINIAVYMVVFLRTAWDGFVRNDVK